MMKTYHDSKVIHVQPDWGVEQVQGCCFENIFWVFSRCHNYNDDMIECIVKLYPDSHIIFTDDELV